MKRWAVVVVGFALVAVGIAVAPARASSQTDAVETRTLELVNQGRGGQGKGAELMHAGLRIAARGHSQDMAVNNYFDHRGYPDRVNTANPDPAEANGPPDDGFNGSSCENIAWYQPAGSATTEQVSQQLYSLWLNSAPHKDCMFDNYGYNLNVAGLGVYYDGGTNKWFATFDSARDNTPPSASPTPTPAPTATPAPTPTPTPTPGWVRVQQSDSRVTYSGTWTTLSVSSASGGTLKRSTVTGAAASFTFTGTGVKWLGAVSPKGGIANVKLDGVQVATVDQYASSAAFQKTLYTRTGLVPGSHTIQVSVSGQRNPSASDQATIVDAFDYTL